MQKNRPSELKAVTSALLKSYKAVMAAYEESKAEDINFNKIESLLDTAHVQIEQSREYIKIATGKP